MTIASYAGFQMHSVFMGNLMDDGEFVSKRRRLPDMAGVNDWMRWHCRCRSGTAVQLGNHQSAQGAPLSGTDPRFSPLSAEARQESARRVYEIAPRGKTQYPRVEKYYSPIGLLGGSSLPLLS